MTDTLDIAPKVTWLFVFLILYWSYCIFWGIRGAAQARSARDYFLANGSLPAWVFVLAATATSFSGWSFLSHPGQVFQDGLPYAFAGLYAITIPLTGVLFLKRQWLVGRRWGFVTPGEMLAWYYRSDALRLLTVLVALFFSVPYLGLQLKAAGYLFNVVTGGLLGLEFGMWVLAMVVISYVATGGLRTVAYVSLLQALLLMVGIVAIAGVALWLVGGWDRLAEGLGVLAVADPVRTPDGHSHLVAIPDAIQWLADGSGAIGGTWTGTMIMTYLLALMGIQSSPAFSMWAMAARSPAPFGVQQVWVSGLVMGLILVVCSTIQGLAGHLLGANPVMLFHRPDLVQPLMAVELEGLDIRVLEGGYETLVARLINLAGLAWPWSVGLLTICALAALESTASAYMATAGAMITRDVLRRYLLPGCSIRTQKFAGRLAVAGVVVLALVVAGSSTDALVLLGGLAVSYGLQMWPALIGLCYWSFLTRQGVVAGLVTGLVAVTLTGPVGPQWLGITDWGRWPLTIHAAGWGLACNLLVAVVVSAMTVDEPARKGEVHAFIQHHAGIAPGRRWLIPLAWLACGVWFGVMVGPGAVIGNDLLGSPDEPDRWLLGLPSLAWWLLAAWVSGVSLLGLLAYGLGLSRDVEEPIESLRSEGGGGGERRLP